MNTWTAIPILMRAAGVPSADELRAVVSALAGMLAEAGFARDVVDALDEAYDAIPEAAPEDEHAAEAAAAQRRDEQRVTPWERTT